MLRTLTLLSLLGCGNSNDSEGGVVLVSARGQLEKKWEVTAQDVADDWQNKPATYADSELGCSGAKLAVHANEKGDVTLRLTRDFDWVTHISKVTLDKKVLVDAGRPDNVTMERLPYATTTFELADEKAVAAGATFGGELVMSLDQMKPTGKNIEASADRVVDEGKWHKLPPSTWKVTIKFPDDAAREKFAELDRAARELKELDSRLSLNEGVIADARKWKGEDAKAFVKLADSLIAERDARKKLVGDPNALSPIAIEIGCAKP